MPSVFTTISKSSLFRRRKFLKTYSRVSTEQYRPKLNLQASLFCVFLSNLESQAKTESPRTFPFSSVRYYNTSWCS